MIVVTDDAVVRYIERALDVTIDRPCISFGLMTDGKEPLCAVVFNDYNGANIEMTMVCERMTRGVVRYIAQYVFGKCGCERLTVRIKKQNKRAIRAAKRFGFVFEAGLRRYYKDDDAHLFRMLKAECRWLKDENAEPAAAA